MKKIKTDFKLRFHCFKSSSGETQTEQLADCYSQLNQFAINNHNCINTIVKQSIFISTKNTSDYYKKKAKLLALSQKFFAKLPATTILAQTPENICVSIEILFFEGIKSSELQYKQNDVNSWIVFRRDNLKIIFASGIGGNLINSNILQRSTSAYEQLQDIFEAEKMNFSDIIKQWNYIENITGNLNHEYKENQNYQIFNDVRSKYYNHSNFYNGYPAATGIGISFGGFILDIIAVKTDNKHSIIAIKSPLQDDAHTYTPEVLSKTNFNSLTTLTTPKFERAKAFTTPTSTWLFISGTAAIKGQVSIALFDVDLQTEIAIECILSLISNENLETYGIKTLKNKHLTYLRVYIKYPNDIVRVKLICEKHFTKIPITYVVADICRSELLVEIEGYIILNSAENRITK